MDVCPQGWGGEEVKNKGARGSIWGERQHCFLNVVVVVTQLSVKTLNRMSFTGYKQTWLTTSLPLPES